MRANLISLLLFASTLAHGAQVLRSIAEISALTPEEAAEARDVHIFAIVTYPQERGSCFVQDDTGSIFVGGVETSDVGDSLLPGDRVEIRGITDPGRYRAMISHRKGTDLDVRFLRHGEVPEPRRIPRDLLNNLEIDSQWVEFEAVIHSISPVSWGGFTVEAGGRLFPVRIRNSPTPERLPKSWFAGPVRIRAIGGTAFNEDRQMTSRIFLVPALEGIQPVEPVPEETLFALPVTPLNLLFRADGPAVTTRIRIRGTVTMAEKGRGIYLRSGRESILVATALPGLLEPGDVVDVVGWPTLGEFKPELRTAIYRKIGREGTPVAQPMEPARIMRGGAEAALVSVRAELIEQTRTPDYQEFILRSGEIVFQARLAAAADTPPLFPLAKGSIVEASGICHGQLTIDYHLPVQARTFTITMRDAADMRLLSSPPWWTVRRLGWVLVATAAAAALSLVWAVMLRKRVERQTAIIGKQIERQSVLGERQRIARELHDTLEQELAGVGMQLDNASRHLSDRPEETRRALHIAGRMLRHSREESRSSIVELRSIALEQRGLAGAIEELLRPLVDGSGIGFRLHVLGEPGPLSTVQGNHLLRIAQEAVSNATRHSRARTITVSLEYSATGVSLEVTDDGCGFTPEAGVDLSGHFGLLGMQERAAKLRTRLTIRSEPGAGTTVRIAVPMEDLPPAH